MNIETFDRNHLWHPYTSMVNPLPVYPVAEARGTEIILTDGRHLVDGMSSWWAAIHGYNHPVLNEAARDQLEKMAHVMFGGFTHEPAVRLGARLVELTPAHLKHVFFSDSGSVSVEVATKMALQYWQAADCPQKNRLLTIRSGYHGDTFGAMAVCDPEKGMHRIFSGVLADHFFADAPRCGYDDSWDESDILSLRAILEKHHQHIAAIIMEPVVQGAGGMRFYSPHYVRRARELSHQFNVLLILDEIATGFGRTGTLFACEQARISPDILCVGKALTGGYMTLAATLATQKVSEVISSGNPGLFMHGPTFMANPLACAISLASVDLLTSSPWKNRVQQIEKRLKQDLFSLLDLPHVADVRVLGAIGVVELVHEVDMARIQRRFVERGVWLRPFGRLVYTMPPYIIAPEQLKSITHAMTEVIQMEGQKEKAFK